MTEISFWGELFLLSINFENSPLLVCSGTLHKKALYSCAIYKNKY